MLMGFPIKLSRMRGACDADRRVSGNEGNRWESERNAKEDVAYGKGCGDVFIRFLRHLLIKAMGMEITSVHTKDGKKIILREKQWQHIKHRHPEMANRLNDIEEAIRNPTVRIRYSDATTKFYRFIKREKKYMMVAARFFNGEGCIITAYPTKRVQREEYVDKRNKI
jgi:hypothetical protein